MCGDVLQSADPSRVRLYGESPTTCPRFICESSHIISTLWWLDSRVDLPDWWLFDHDDSRVKSRVESPVNRVVSRPRLAITWLPAVDEPDFWRCWKPVSGCAGNASRPRNKLRTRSPFSVWFGAGFESSGLNSGSNPTAVSPVHNNSCP